MFSDLFADDRLLRSYSVLCGIPEPVAAEILQRKNELPLEAAAALRARDERFAERLSADLQCVYACLLILEDVPLTIAQHRGRGFPWEITLETLSDIGIWCNDLFKREKRCGILPAQIKWLNHQKNMEIVRIGRFQYMTRPCFGGRIKVFRRKKRTGYRILAEHGLSMTREGQRTEENAAFHTVYRENAQSFSGNPVENGYVLPDALALSRKEWDKVLEYGDPMLSVHIPADGPMTPEVSLRSLREAADFFRIYYPNLPWKGFWYALERILVSLLAAGSVSPDITAAVLQYSPFSGTRDAVSCFGEIGNPVPPDPCGKRRQDTVSSGCGSGCCRRTCFSQRRMDSFPGTA